VILSSVMNIRKIKLLYVFLVIINLQSCKLEEEMLPHNASIINKIQSLKKEVKFKKDMSKIYFGTPNETIRIQAQNIIDDLLSQLLIASQQPLTELEFWSILEVSAKKLAQMDSEEMDRGLNYMEDIMSIYNIESSDGRLNDWRYGFNPENIN